MFKHIIIVPFSLITVGCVVAQALVLKYLLFYPDGLGKGAPNMHHNLGSRTLSSSHCVASTNFSSLSEDAKAR